MARKFIPLVIAASMAITGMTTAPAKANDRDLAIALAAIAGVAVVGKVIHDQNKKDKRKREAAQRRYEQHRYNNYNQRRYDNRYSYQPQRPVHARPAPKRHVKPAVKQNHHSSHITKQRR